MCCKAINTAKRAKPSRRRLFHNPQNAEYAIMKINMAHVRERSTTGTWINFAVFDAKATNGDNDSLLAQLTAAARNAGLRVDQSAIAYRVGTGIRFFGSPHLVNYLSAAGLPRWTHKLDA
ncbi:hypothetical protein ALQ33_05399 [Pseudomonas syringae pv. philadelphi]|uniref:Uncharacterized protein n=1 Tax=Pseudomonas syringae pv. philadelphi TaxID=251706 RepID=A0A3M3YP89_9PSED|nr:hypothetical protein ALQ33_05399 [Pseudomonas syringae pv. philadelphi]